VRPTRSLPCRWCAPRRHQHAHARHANDTRKANDTRHANL
jgi:hypothetical protein